MNVKRVRAIHPALREDVGSLVTWRAFPTRQVRIDEFDPFLFLNHHGPQNFPPDNEGLPFGPHPHRGFETVTFILSGSLAHRDSEGGTSIIEAGGVQWMTAGRGLIHAELSPAPFRRSGGNLEILQLWINLPSHLKMIPPRYVGLQHDQIPRLALDEGRVSLHLVAGSWNGSSGAVNTFTERHVAVVHLERGGEFSHSIPTHHRVLLYVVRGRVDIAGQVVGWRQTVELDEGEELVSVRGLESSVLIFAYGQPTGEPVRAAGPFVMNTDAELTEAMRDYHSGRLGTWEE